MVGGQILDLHGEKEPMDYETLLRMNRLKTGRLIRCACLLGCVAYMVCGLFSDSTLYTSPVFYVFAGLVLSAKDK